MSKSQRMQVTEARRDPAEAKRRRVLPTALLILVILGVLASAGYLIKLLVVSQYFFCFKSWRFIPVHEACDGTLDCPEGEDELDCVSSERTNTTFPLRLVGEDWTLQVWREGDGWSSVCADDWPKNHTRSVCQQLGYTLNPVSRKVPVNSLPSSLVASFSAVKLGAKGPLQSAITKRETCSTGSVIALTCSDCGEVQGADRIVGGGDATIEEFPWQASLQKDRQHVCGGSLVSLTWIVTAAHCFGGHRQEEELHRWQVVLGTTNLKTSGGHSLAAIIIHKDYSSTTNDYDIAMLQLSKPVTTGDTIRPVCLPPYSPSLKAGHSVVITGWGLLKEKGQISPVLQTATVDLMDRDVCSSPAVYGHAFTPRMLCAGEMGGKVDACQGDSGGPLVYQSERWQLVGIVSWGVGCARRGYPGVYSRVDYLLNWVFSVMEKHS